MRNSLPTTYLFVHRHISIRKRVRPEHADENVLVLVNLQVLREAHRGQPAVHDVLEVGPHLEAVAVGRVAAVEPRREHARHGFADDRHRRGRLEDPWPTHHTGESEYGEKEVVAIEAVAKEVATEAG